eukprot:351323-Chlamydomonas_euryale.AAC.7
MPCSDAGCPPASTRRRHGPRHTVSLGHMRAGSDTWPPKTLMSPHTTPRMPQVYSTRAPQEPSTACFRCMCQCSLRHTPAWHVPASGRLCMRRISCRVRRRICALPAFLAAAHEGRRRQQQRTIQPAGGEGPAAGGREGDDGRAGVRRLALAAGLPVTRGAGAHARGECLRRKLTSRQVSPPTVDIGRLEDDLSWRMDGRALHPGWCDVCGTSAVMPGRPCACCCGNGGLGDGGVDLSLLWLDHFAPQCRSQR